MLFPGYPKSDPQGLPKGTQGGPPCSKGGPGAPKNDMYGSTLLVHIILEAPLAPQDAHSATRLVQVAAKTSKRIFGYSKNNVRGPNRAPQGADVAPQGTKIRALGTPKIR